jgi:erythromycin esterase
MTEAGVANWVRERAVPLAGVAPDTPAEDLVPLGRLLGDATVVGIGESSHGTKEFFEVRHRLIRHLVTECGFTTLATEASYSATDPLNSYLRGEQSDVSEALAALGHLMWKVREFGELLEWLREHNASVDESRRVEFLGLDMVDTGRSREQVLAALQAAGSARADTIEDVYAEIGTAGWQLALRPEEERKRFAVETQAALDEVASGSYPEDIVRHARSVAQWAHVNAPGPEVADMLPNAKVDVFARSRFMAENLAAAKGKAVVLAHNVHVGVGYWEESIGVARNMGAELRSRLGDRYCALGLELGNGTYLAQVWSSEEWKASELMTAGVEAAPEGSVPWQFLRAGVSRFVLPLRGTEAAPDVDQWLRGVQRIHSIPWNYSDGHQFFCDVVLKDAYDAVVFVADTSASTPA